MSKGDMEVGDSANNVPVSHESSDKCARRTNGLSTLLRIASAALTAVAMALMITDKETHVYVVDPTYSIYKKVKYTGVPAFVYFVYVNGIIAGYNLVQALLSLLPSVNKTYHPSHFCLWLTFLLDQFSLYALIAAVGCSTEVFYIAENGSSAAQWTEICSTYGKFCNRLGASIIICFIGILFLIVLAAASAHRLFSSASARPYSGKPSAGGAPKHLGTR